MCILTFRKIFNQKIKILNSVQILTVGDCYNKKFTIPNSIKILKCKLTHYNWKKYIITNSIKKILT